MYSEEFLGEHGTCTRAPTATYEAANAFGFLFRTGDT